MSDVMPQRQLAAAIVRDAGGTLVGRTRLQKVAYLLELAGLGDGFVFEYRHYGPFSEELADGIYTAGLFNLVHEEERPTDWGGFYSIYKSTQKAGTTQIPGRSAFAKVAASITAIELELLATAAYLNVEEGYENPWEETAIRKPEKAEGRIEKAKEAYRQLLALDTPEPLPKIV